MSAVAASPRVSVREAPFDLQAESAALTAGRECRETEAWLN